MLVPCGHFRVKPAFTNPVSTVVVDGAGKSCAYIGQIHFADGPGTSKTFSSAGGKIYWMSGSTLTWASAGSTVRVGIQDVNASGVNDDIWDDVYDDLVQGTDTITVVTMNTVTMSTGSRTLTHGDLIAVVIEMTVKNGTDQVRPLYDAGVAAHAGGFPYLSNDTTGGGPSKGAGTPSVTLGMDDGTLAVLHPAACLGQIAATTFGSGSTPDEYALVFRAPYRAALSALCAHVGDYDASDTGSIRLYEQATSASPVLVRSVTVPPATLAHGLAGGSTAWTVAPINEYICEPGSFYAVSYAATSAGTTALNRWTAFPPGARVFMPWGVDCWEGTRSNDAGAFTLSSTTLPRIGYLVSKIDDGRRAPRTRPLRD